MTTTEFVAGLRARGLTVAATRAGKLRVEPRAKLTAADRAALRQRTPAILALLAVERALRERDEAGEREQAELVRRLAERAEAERARMRREVIPAWDEGKVLALADAGRITAADVREWTAAREELISRREREHRRALGMALGAALEGRAARIVDAPDGSVAVELATPGTGSRRSTWNGGFFGYIAREREREG